MYWLYIWTADVITLWPYLLHVRAVSLAREGRKPPHCHIPARLIAPSHPPHGHSKPTGGAQEEVPPWAHAGVREVTLLVSNHSMRVGDRGVVVVGGSAQTGDLAGHFAAGALLMMDGLFNGQCCSCMPSSFTCSNLEQENDACTTIQGQEFSQPCGGKKTGGRLAGGTGAGV